MDLPGWHETGPERGHVMDVATRGDEVLALTRIGVLRADRSLQRWSRTPEFPTNTRHLTTTADGVAVWSNTPRRLWRVDTRARPVASLPEGGVLVDLAGVPGGAVIAMRGDTHGVWRVTEDGAVSPVLPDVDPWVLATHGSEVDVGTLDRGLWTSADEGRTFVHVGEDAAVSAIGRVSGQLWVAYADGRITRGGGETVCTSEAGPPIAIAEVAGRALLVIDSLRGPLPDLYACGADGTADKLPSGLPGEDGLEPQPTGLWPVDPDHAVLGTFRTGAALVDASGAHYARNGFRATLASAVAQTSTGELLLGLMSTGVFHSVDQGATWTSIASGPTDASHPVSDAMDVAVAGERLLVVDFEGITIGRGDRWYRTEGASVEGSGRGNALMEVGADGAGTLWGRDFAGGLWREARGRWRRCAQGDVLRIDGQGSAMLLATTTGFVRPDACDTPGTRAWADLAGDTTGLRSDGHWVAGHGRLWRDGQIVGSLQAGMVQAIAARVVGTGEEVLVAGDRGTVQRCTEAGCAPAARALPSPVVAIGWLADGRIWATEQQGSFLVAEGDADLPGVSDANAVATETASARPSLDVAGPAAEATLTIPPWRGVGRADFAGALKSGAAVLPLTRPSPDSRRGIGAADAAPREGSSSAWLYALYAIEATAAAVIAWSFLGRGRPRRRRRR